MYQSNYGYYPTNGMRQTVVPAQTTIPMTPQSAAMLKGHPVSSLEEARATTIDFDGSIFFFPDLANKKIYTKQINVDGTASLNLYELKDLPVAPTTSGYITREEFDSVIAELRKSLGTGATQQSPAPTQQTAVTPNAQQPVAQYNF